MSQDLKLLYQQYSQNDGAGTYEEFVQAKEELGEEAFNSLIENTVKKKDQPTENGSQNLTTSTPTPQTDLPTLPNPIPENEFTVPMGSEQDLMSASSDTTVEMPSTDLPLTDVASSGTESLPTNPLITGNAQQPTYTKPSVGAMVYPIGNEEIEQYNDRVFQRNRVIIPQVNTMPIQPNESQGERKISLSIDTDINNESLITEDGEKAYANINGFNIPKELLPDESDNDNILYDRDGNLNPWIKADKISLDELKIAPFNEYATSLTGNIEEDNNNIIAQEKLGNVEIKKTDDGDYAKNAEGKVIFKFTNKNYYDETYVPYVQKVNAERVKKEDETNLGATYKNRIIYEKPNTELDDLYDEFESVFGRKPTDEEKLSVYSPETLLKFRENIEVARLKKLNPNTDENTLKQQAFNKFNITSSDVQTGANVLNLINESFKRDASNEGFVTSNNNGQYRSTDKDEFDQWLNIASNQNELGSFGKYWKEEGEAEFGSSWIKQRQITYQEKRFEIMGAYLDWKKKDARILNEAKQNLIKQSKLNTKQAAEKGDGELLNTTAQATATLLNDYGQFVNNLKAQENADIEIYSKFKREQDKYNAQQDAKTDFINGEDKPAQYAANLVLGFASSIQSTVTGVARLASLPFGEGTFSDAVDVMGKPLTISRYQSAPLSLNIKRYEGGIDDGGNKFEYREVNGEKYTYSNGKYSRMLGNIPEKAKLIDTETEYTAAGFIFQGSKMATDIILTQGMGSAINKGIGTVSSKVFKWSRANALANTKNLASVFGNESLLAIGSASLYKASRNINNASVTGWTVQMTEDSYQQGKKAGLEGKYLVGYTLFNSGLQSIIQRINPDVKFLKSIQTDHYNLTQALLSKNTDKALLYFNNIKGKIIDNATGETIEESVQQVAQDFTNLFTNSLTSSDLTFGNANDYRDILISTPILSGALGASMGRNGKATANIGGRNIDISSLTTAELETEIARNKGSEKFIKDYIDSAYFDSVKERATEILNSIETRAKYISKIPNQQRYSTNTVTQASVLLQQKEKLEKELKETDDSMKFLIEGELESTKTKIRDLFDNSGINKNFNAETENSINSNSKINLNAKTGDTLYETPQPAPQSETVQEQTNTTDNEPEQTAVQQPKPIAPIEPSGGAGATAESGVEQTVAEQPTQNISPNDEVRPIGQLGNGSNIYFETPKYRVNESYNSDKVILNVGETESLSPLTSIEFDDAKEAVYVAEKLNEALPDGLTRDYHNVDNIIANFREEYKNETNPTETTTQSDTATVENVQDIPADVNNETEINEDNIVLPDDFLDLLNNIDNETTQTTNTATNGNTESTIDSVQQSEQTGETNQQEVHATADIGASEWNAEVGNVREENGILITNTPSFSDVKIVDFENANLDSRDYSRLVDAFYNNEGTWDKGLKNDVKNLGNGWYSLGKTSDGFSVLHSPELDKTIVVESKNGVIDSMVVNNIVENNTSPVQQNHTFSDNEQAKPLNEKTVDIGKVLNPDQKKTNTLISFKNDYNRLSKARKEQIKGKELFSQINNLSRELGIPVSNAGDGKISIKNPKTGKEMAKIRETVTEKTPSKKEVEFAKIHIPDLILWNRDRFSPRWDADISWDDIRKGASDIEKGNLNTVPAIRLINEVNRQAKDLGGFNFITGSGGITQIDFVSLQEIENMQNEFPKTWDALNILTDEQLKQLYDERKQSEQAFYTNQSLQDENSVIYEEGQNVSGDSRVNGEPSQSATEREKSEYQSEEVKQSPISENQKRIADNVIVTKESFISPDGEESVRVTVTDNEGNAVEDKNGDYEFEFGTVAEADKFIDQKQKGYSLASNRRNTPKAEITGTTNNADAGQRVNFTFLGEKQSGIIQEGNTILGDDGKKYPKGLAKNVTDVDGNKIDFQNAQADFTPIPQSTYDKLVKILLGVFKKFGGKVITTKAEVDAKLKEFGYEGTDLQNITPIKSRQLEIINRTNPAPNNYNTWVRSESDILTAEEAFRTAFEDGEMYPDFTIEDMQQALDSGFLTVYSSKPIEDGNFVTPSKMNAQEYAGGKNGKVYSQKVKTSDIAWIDESEGQYARIEFMKTKDGEIYGAKFPDGTIYLNPEKINANTPIHEFSHLWQQLMPTRFKKGVELLKNTPIGKRAFAELKANEGYANKSEEELWNEAMVTIMGNEGERIFNAPRASKLKEWLTDLFKALGNAFGIRDLSPNDKLSTFVKGALSEVMGTKEIIPESNVEQKEVPIYIKKMSNTDLRTMLDKLGLVMDAVCPN